MPPPAMPEPGIAEPDAPQSGGPWPGMPQPGVPQPLLELGQVGPVNLAGWKLTLPQASEKGTAASVEPADSVPPWLVRAVDGSLNFWAPVDGVTTPNSTHPRTELVSLNHFKAGTSPRILRASLAVAQAPRENQDVIIGQIHGADDISSVSFVMLHYTAGGLRVVVKKGQSGSASDNYPLLTGLPLGARFDYTISDTGDGNVTVSASYGPRHPKITAPIPTVFRNATVRFQAGAYQQGEKSSGADDGARIIFYSLTESSEPAARPSPPPSPPPSPGRP
ncbi:MAG TPA: polysaccharide lyase family 7 protein [Pseudonocardia sp.]|uniref:polysaccharide lyase family 7 protein n=1 Tax=Pseudonocardia sp. TaxID=60912 RepID=UPI002EDB9653